MVAWLTATVLIEAAWLTIIIMWILVSVNKDDGVRAYVDTLDMIKYITVYGGYAVLWIVVLVASYILPASAINTGYPAGQTSGSGFGISFSLLLLIAVDLFVQLFFDRDLHKWVEAVERKAVTDANIAEDKKKRKELGLDAGPDTVVPGVSDSEVDEMNEKNPVVPDFTPDDTTIIAEPEIPDANNDFGNNQEIDDSTEIDPWGETNFEFDWNNFIAHEEAKGLEKDIEEENKQNTDF